MKKLSKLLIIGCCLFLWCNPLLSQQAETVQISSLDEAIAIAQRQNKNLTANTLRLKKSETELKLAKSAQRSQISGSFSGQKNLELATTFVPGELFGQPGETVAAQFGQEYQYNAGITLNKSLINLSNYFNVKSKKQNIDIQKSSNALYKENLKGQISLAYHSLLIAEEALALAREDLIVADSIVDIAQSKYEQGLFSKSQFLKAQINYNRVFQGEKEASLVYEDAHEQLKDLLGTSSATTIILLQELQLSPLSDTPDDTLTENLEIQQNFQYKKQSEMSLKLARAEYFPTISLNAYNGSQLFQDDFNFSVSNENWTPLRYVGLNINLPLFNGSATRRKVKMARLESEISALQFESEKNRLESQDALLLKNKSLAASISNTSRENYLLYKEICELEYARFAEGLIALDDYLNSFEDYLNAKNAYLNSLTSYHQYYAQFYARS